LKHVLVEVSMAPTTGDCGMVKPDSGIAGPRHPVLRKFLWGGLPDFCALVPVVWCLSHAITMVVVGPRIGRQSSTFVIGPFLAVIGAPFLAAAGLLVGKLLAFLLRSRMPPGLTRMAIWCAPLLLAMIAIAAYIHARAPLYAAEREARPRVIVNAMQIARHTAKLEADGFMRATRVYDHLAKVNQPIPWGDRSVRLANLGTTLEVGFSPTGNPLKIPLPGISYVTAVDAVPLAIGPRAHPMLALLITGRATGRRDLIALVSDNGDLAYLELLDRFWNFRSVPLAIMPSPTGDLVLVGTDPQNLLVFAP
jgi:hypothetical protein